MVHHPPAPALEQSKILDQPKGFAYETSMTPTHLRSFQALELALRTRSLTAAAARLAITPAAVGQRIKALEDYLGVTLLVRGRDGIRAIPEAVKAWPHLSTAFAALEAAATVLDIERAQELHLAAPPDFAELWLEPRLPRFRERHPQRPVCHQRRRRRGPPPRADRRRDCARTSKRVGQLLFRDFVTPLIAPANLSMIETSDGSRWLDGFPLIAIGFYEGDPAPLTWPRWLADNGFVRSGAVESMRYQRVRHGLDAVRAGAGAALCGIALARERLADGSVTPAFAATTERLGFSMRWRGHLVGARAAERFNAWLFEEAAATTREIERFGAEPPPACHP